MKEYKCPEGDFEVPEIIPCRSLNDERIRSANRKRRGIVWTPLGFPGATITDIQLKAKALKGLKEDLERVEKSFMALADAANELKIAVPTIQTIDYKRKKPKKIPMYQRVSELIKKTSRQSS